MMVSGLDSNSRQADGVTETNLFQNFPSKLWKHCKSTSSFSFKCKISTIIPSQSEESKVNRKDGIFGLKNVCFI